MNRKRSKIKIRPHISKHRYKKCIDDVEVVKYEDEVSYLLESMTLGDTNMQNNDPTEKKLCSDIFSSRSLASDNLFGYKLNFHSGQKLNDVLKPYKHSKPSYVLSKMKSEYTSYQGNVTLEQQHAPNTSLLRSLEHEKHFKSNLKSESSHQISKIRKENKHSKISSLRKMSKLEDACDQSNVMIVQKHAAAVSLSTDLECDKPFKSNICTESSQRISKISKEKNCSKALNFLKASKLEDRTSDQGIAVMDTHALDTSSITSRVCDKPYKSTDSCQRISKILKENTCSKPSNLVKSEKLENTTRDQNNAIMVLHELATCSIKSMECKKPLKSNVITYSAHQTSKIRKAHNRVKPSRSLKSVKFQSTSKQDMDQQHAPDMSSLTSLECDKPFASKLNIQSAQSVDIFPSAHEDPECIFANVFALDMNFPDNIKFISEIMHFLKRVHKAKGSAQSFSTNIMNRNSYSRIFPHQTFELEVTNAEILILTVCEKDNHFVDTKLFAISIGKYSMIFLPFKINRKYVFEFNTVLFDNLNDVTIKTCLAYERKLRFMSGGQNCVSKIVTNPKFYLSLNGTMLLAESNLHISKDLAFEKSLSQISKAARGQNTKDVSKNLPVPGSYTSRSYKNLKMVSKVRETISDMILLERKIELCNYSLKKFKVKSTAYEEFKTLKRIGKTLINTFENYASKKATSDMQQNSEKTLRRSTKRVLNQEIVLVPDENNLSVSINVDNKNCKVQSDACKKRQRSHRSKCYKGNKEHDLKKSKLLDECIMQANNFKCNLEKKEKAVSVYDANSSEIKTPREVKKIKKRENNMKSDNNKLTNTKNIAKATVHITHSVDQKINIVLPQPPPHKRTMNFEDESNEMSVPISESDSSKSRMQHGKLKDDVSNSTKLISAKGKTFKLKNKLSLSLSLNMETKEYEVTRFETGKFPKHNRKRKKYGESSEKLSKKSRLLDKCITQESTSKKILEKGEKTSLVTDTEPSEIEESKKNHQRFKNTLNCNVELHVTTENNGKDERDLTDTADKKVNTIYQNGSFEQGMIFSEKAHVNPAESRISETNISKQLHKKLANISVESISAQQVSLKSDHKLSSQLINTRKLGHKLILQCEESPKRKCKHKKPKENNDIGPKRSKLLDEYIMHANTSKHFVKKIPNTPIIKEIAYCGSNMSSKTNDSKKGKINDLNSNIEQSLPSKIHWKTKPHLTDPVDKEIKNILSRLPSLEEDLKDSEKHCKIPVHTNTTESVNYDMQNCKSFVVLPYVNV